MTHAAEYNELYAVATKLKDALDAVTRMCCQNTDCLWSRCDLQPDLEKEKWCAVCKAKDAVIDAVGVGL